MLADSLQAFWDVDQLGCELFEPNHQNAAG
jgi:hypothetical protein